ncbi:MAG: rarD [Rhodoglobus sp.]|nr:rarD [Rhodoglobus sp.]
MTPATVPDKVSGSGLAFAASSYLLWGFLPLLFFALSASGAIEIVAWRVVLSLVFCALLLTVTRGWGRLVAILRDRTAVVSLAIAGAFVVVNWIIYVYASVSGHVVEASLGYFTNPIVTVLLGVLVLRERLRPLQWVAIAVSAVAVVILAIGYGSFPWIALGLAFSFGFYGLVKKRVGGRADAIGGLTVETAVLSPLAIVALIVVGSTTGLTLVALGTTHTILMLSLGIATAVPLLLFAAAARRLPLTYMGLMQYLAPILQLLVGVLIAHEAMPPERWLGFGIVWLALAILTVDMFLHSTRQRGVAAVEASGAP